MASIYNFPYKPSLFKLKSEIRDDFGIEFDNIIELNFPEPFIKGSIDQENTTFSHVHNLIVERRWSDLGSIIK